MQAERIDNPDDMDAAKFGEHATQLLHDAQPLLTHEQVLAIEEEVEALAPFRRAALCALKLSGDQFMEYVTGDRDKALSITAVNCATQNLPALLRAIAEDIETFGGRSLVALAQREDMEELEAEIKAEAVINAD